MLCSLSGSFVEHSVEVFRNNDIMPEDAIVIERDLVKDSTVGHVIMVAQMVPTRKKAAVDLRTNEHPLWRNFLKNAQIGLFLTTG